MPIIAFSHILQNKKQNRFELLFSFYLDSLSKWCSLREKLRHFWEIAYSFFFLVAQFLISYVEQKKHSCSQKITAKKHIFNLIESNKIVWSLANKMNTERTLKVWKMITKMAIEICVLEMVNQKCTYYFAYHHFVEIMWCVCVCVSGGINYMPVIFA